MTGCTWTVEDYKGRQWTGGNGRFGEAISEHVCGKRVGENHLLCTRHNNIIAKLAPAFESGYEPRYSFPNGKRNPDFIRDSQARRYWLAS